MKSTTIPAQVTTVEDKIANNLNLTQLTLLIAPVLASAIIYVFLPKAFKFTIYKIPLILISFIIFPTLSTRVKGKVLINWLFLLVRFILRPHIYIFDKNNLYMRNTIFLGKVEKKKNIKKPDIERIEDKKSQIETSLIDYQTVKRNKNVNLHIGKNKILLTKNYENI